MADESHCHRWQDPITKAFHFSGCVTLEDMQRVMKISSNDSAVLDHAFDITAGVPQWLKGFAWIFARIKEKRIGRGS